MLVMQLTLADIAQAKNRAWEHYHNGVRPCSAQGLIDLRAAAQSPVLARMAGVDAWAARFWRKMNLALVEAEALTEIWYRSGFYRRGEALT